MLDSAKPTSLSTLFNSASASSNFARASSNTTSPSAATLIPALTIACNVILLSFTYF